MDAELPAKIKTGAPISVLAFGRAISLGDYEAIALQAGAARATAYYAWNGVQQKAVVTLYVGDDDNAVTAAAAALAAAVDPSIPFVVLPPNLIPCVLGVTLQTAPSADPTKVTTAVVDALLDPSGSLFGTGAAIGAPLYDSQIAAVCMRVPGVIEVQLLGLFTGVTPPLPPPPPVGSTVTPADLEAFVASLPSVERHLPGEGGLFTLPPNNILIAVGANDYGLGR
jgi:hypothetical protein